MKDKVIEALKTVEDPELLLDIWFVGLIYKVEVDDNAGNVDIEMTFTTPLCPAGPDIVNEVYEKVGEVDGVSKVEVKVVFDPPWKPSDELKGLLGLA